MVEIILMQAKKDGKTSEVTAAKDRLDGKTPVDLAKERLAEVAAASAAAGGGGGGGADGEASAVADEKGKLDQIVALFG